MFRKKQIVLYMLIITLVISACYTAYAVNSGTGVEKQRYETGNRQGISKPKNIILIGWDGTQRNHLKEMIARKEVPNLMQLTSKGRLVAIDALRTTDTKAGWAQILTGYEPEVNHVFSNNVFRPIPVGYTVFERLETFFGPNAIYTAAIIGKRNNLGAAGPIAGQAQGAQNRRGARRQAAQQRAANTQGARRAAVQQRRQQRQAGRQGQGGNLFGEPYYRTKDHIDLFEEGLMTADNVGARALQVLDRHGAERFFIFIHFAEPDPMGHQSGENSEQYTASIRRDDAWLGKIVAKLEALGIRDETLIYVTADHGFDEGKTSHSDAPYVFLATDDPKVMRRGLREDITPTILQRFGLNLSTITPPLNGHPLTQPYTPPIW